MQDDIIFGLSRHLMNFSVTREVNLSHEFPTNS